MQAQDLPDKLIRDTQALWARRIASFAGGLLLAAWCVALLLPRTAFDRFVSPIALLPLRFADVVAEFACVSDVWRSIFLGPVSVNPWLVLAGLAVFALIVWRCRVLTVLTTGGRTAKLVSGALLSFGLLILVDFLTSSANSYPFGDQTQHLLLVAFVLAFALTANARWWRFLLGVILACVVLQSAYAVAFYVRGTDLFVSPGIIPRAAGTMITPLILYPVCMIGVLLLIPLAVSEHRAKLRLLYWVSIAVVIGALFLTFTRAAAIGLAVGLMWLAYEERRDRRFRILAVLALFVMVITMMARATTRTGNFGMDRSALGRVQIWRMSANIIRDHWLLGVGYNGYRDIQNRYVDARAQGINYTNIDPLNQVLTMTASHGVLGAGVFLLFIYATWAGCRSGKKEDFAPREWRVIQGVKLAGIGILTAGLTDTPLYGYDRFPGTFIWLVCMGFLLHLAVRENPPSGSWKYARPCRIGVWGVTGAVVLGMLVVITLGGMDAHHASESFDAKVEGIRLDPSFTPIGQIPQAMADCVIVNEDGNFHHHHGYSPIGMHRALRVNMRAGRIKQGLSLIHI